VKILQPHGFADAVNPQAKASGDKK